MLINKKKKQPFFFFFLWLHSYCTISLCSVSFYVAITNFLNWAFLNDVQPVQNSRATPGRWFESKCHHPKERDNGNKTHVKPEVKWKENTLEVIRNQLLNKKQGLKS